MPLEGHCEPSPVDWVRKQVEQFESSDGREGNTMKDLPVIVLTTKGARTGNIRKSPLMRVEHDGKYLIVASLGGAPSHPVWYHNVVANPTVEIQDGATRQDMATRELDGDEREIWWKRAVDAFPPYAEYQEKTSRVIPILICEPV
ncbi:nitroreductase family deazaflavin-dependent oxidoreductase [Pseudonocardia sp. Cha107L01]|jgi:deazaflavin-dependent oxidoreductase (nitroreductase family)|uniref:nitroreductase family deazaflavin-dependent oxidoreductase n=1 Tax=Pseudonocardia sp. Cha107L01 TaxID=3457576 RepID=UPI00403E3AFE